MKESVLTKGFQSKEVRDAAPTNSIHKAKIWVMHWVMEFN